MSSIDNTDRGNLLVSYLFPEQDVIKNIELEQRLKAGFARVLHENGIRKFLIADDEFINTTLLKATSEQSKQGDKS